MAQREEAIIKNTHIDKAYTEVVSNPTYWGEGGESQFPDFSHLFEEITISIVEERLSMTRVEADRELQRLVMGERFDVEFGYNPTEFGFHSEAEVFNILLLGGYAFTHKGELFNASTQGVW